jgi:hypothetical protein
MNPRAAHFGADEVDLRQVKFTPELLARIPADAARRFWVVPVGWSLGTLRLAIADPSDIQALSSLNELLDCDLEICVAEADQINDFVVRLYGGNSA